MQARVFAQLPAAHILALTSQVSGAWQPGRIIAEHQAMPPAPMFEVIVNACLAAQPLHQFQIRLAVLGAERAGRIGVLQIKPAPVATDAVLPEHLIKNLWYRKITEDALAVTQAQAAQPRPESRPKQPGTAPLFMLDKTVQLPVNTIATRPETQARRTVHQAGKVQVRIIDQHVDLE